MLPIIFLCQTLPVSRVKDHIIMRVFHLGIEQEKGYAHFYIELWFYNKIRVRITIV